jgi:predicted ATP-grasp superfamily ATP-dependent carboligase
MIAYLVELGYPEPLAADHVTEAIARAPGWGISDDGFDQTTEDSDERMARLFRELTEDGWMTDERAIRS